MKRFVKYFFVGFVVFLILAPRQRCRSFTLKADMATETTGFKIESGAPGPILYVVAGIHGNEPAGVEAAEDLKALQLKKGALVVLPKANALAVAKRSRTVTSIGDLNRVFPGKVQGMAVETLARAIFQDIVAYRPDLVVDLHESGHYRSGAKFDVGHAVIYSSAEITALVDDVLFEMNRSADEPYVYFIDALDGTLNSALTTAGIPTITFESDVNLPYSERVTAHKQLLQWVLKAYNMR